MARPIKMPRLSKGMTTGEVAEWLKSPGDALQEGDPLLIVLSEKADVEIDAPVSGTLLKILVPPGKEVSVGALLGWIGQPDELVEEVEATESALSAGTGDSYVHAEPERPNLSSETQSPSPLASLGKVKAVPAARRVAAEFGVSLAGLKGSGPDGLITVSDVRKAVLASPQSADQSAEETARHEETEFERIPLSGTRKMMAERLTISKHTPAAVTTVMDVDMGAVRELKQALPITYTSAVVKAAASGLQEYALLNSSLDGNYILVYKHIHMGVAVDTPQGLRVATVLDANRKSLRDVDEELRRLAQAAKSGRLRTEMVAVPTFTVTNSGVLGSLLFTPMINPPQSATLGMGKVQETPVVYSGQITVRPVMYLCLTYDHRIIEGAEAVRFLALVKDSLEHPQSIV